jgi:hypothetical protein
VLELYGAYLLFAGLAVIAVGYIWLIVRGFHTRWFWGLGLLFFPPLALFFIFRHRRRSIAPLLVILLGGAVIASPFAVNFYNAHFVSLGPRERVVDGELHITLTGWDGDDYSILRSRPQTVVLQMANADVTDQTLEHLRGLKVLRELDLNNTQVTDQGLLVLKELPALETLRLSKTKITDDGFKTYLAPLDGLRELDLRGTAVQSATVRAWKAAKEGRKALK